MSSTEIDPLLPKQERERREREKGALGGWLKDRGVLAWASVLVVCLISVAGAVVYGWRSHLAQNVQADEAAYLARSAAHAGFHCGTCAVVFPSPILTGLGLGPEIDRNECVVRFNYHEPTPQYVADVGAKSDIRLLSYWLPTHRPEQVEDACVKQTCKRHGVCVFFE